MLRSICLIILLCGLASVSQSQDYDFCTNHRVSGIAWSPDGEQLAVLNFQGVHIYDSDLEFIRSIRSPISNDPFTSGGSPIWSPDGQWIILRNHQPMEYLDYAVGSLIWNIVNIHTDEFIVTTPHMGGIAEIAWSPDNQFIAILGYESNYGLTIPYSSIKIFSGVAEPRIEAREFFAEDVHITDLSWQDDTVLTARVDGLVMYFNTDLELIEPPTFSTRWWVANHDGTREASYQPDTLFYVREVGMEVQQVRISPLEYPTDEFGTFGQVEEIYWLPDNERLLGIYYRLMRLQNDYPELDQILQGTVVNAVNAVELNHFMIYADSPIQGYSVSNLGDRIAIYRDYTTVEIWNPLTDEHLKTIEVPAMDFGDICDD